MSILLLSCLRQICLSVCLPDTGSFPPSMRVREPFYSIFQPSSLSSVFSVSPRESTPTHRPIPSQVTSLRPQSAHVCVAEIFRALPGCTNPLCPGISSPSPKHGMTKVPSPLGDRGDEVYLGELQSPMHRGETFQKRFKKKTSPPPPSFPSFRRSQTCQYSAKQR